VCSRSSSRWRGPDALGDARGGASCRSGDTLHPRRLRGRLGAGSLVQALLYAVGDIALLVNTVFGVTTIRLVLTIVFVFNGVLEAFVGLRLHSELRWWALVVSGAFALAIGVLLWIGWPSTAAWAVGLLVGINLLSSGLSMVGLALRGRGTTRGEPTVEN